MKRKINIEVLIEVIILFSISNILFLSLITGKVKYYVHPRLNIYIWFSASTLLIIGIFMIPSLFKPKHSIKFSTYIIIGLPILTAFFIPSNTVSNNSIELGNNISSTTIANKSENITSKQNANDESTSIRDNEYNTNTEKNNDTNNNGNSYNNTQKDSNDESEIVSNSEENKDVIDINDGDYLRWYTDINKNVNQYAGKTIKFKGQVLRIKQFKKNEFVPARKAMVCCAADLQPCGFLCRFKDAEKFKNNEWVLVTAIIQVEKYDGETMPVIYAKSVVKTEAPKNEYVYFNYDR